MTIDRRNIETGITDRIISKHDLVFRSPVPDPLNGIPLGNGHTGWLIWTDERRLNININDTDLIDDGEKRTDGYTSASDENNTVCVNGGLLSIDFGCPVFEAIYQNDFEARLRLGKAAAEIKADTPFMKVNASAFVSSEYNVGVIDIESSSPDRFPLQLSVERWGSRTFMYWYSALSGSPSDGLDGTESGYDDNCIYITQKLRDTSFCIAACAESDSCFRKGIAGTHRSEFTANTSTSHKARLFVTLTVASDTETALQKAKEKLRTASTAGIGEIQKAHEAEWRSYWNRSFISLPDSDDFVENLWYLNLYYANCEMRGKYPPHFCEGVWGNYHDFVPWNLYFHYNTQHAVYPLAPAGHPELCDTYYRFRMSQLPQAKRYAREIKGADGIFYADVCDMKGRMTSGVSDNCTCGAQIALMMYSHWRYTGDESFLKETVMPVIDGCIRFYEDMFVKEDDGLYHIHQTQGYEGSPLLDDSITDHAAFRSLLKAGIEIFPERAKELTEYLTHLAPYVTAELLDDELDKNGAFAYGIGKGEKPSCGNVLSVGIKGGEKLRKTFGNPEHDYYGFPDTEMAPLYPAGLVGIKDKDSELYNLIKNSILLHHHAIHDADSPEHGSTCMGWCMMPVYLARMGMGDKLWNHLSDTVSTWIIFPQGFGAYTPTDIDQDIRKRNSVISGGYTYRSLAWRFRHFDYETLPICAYAITEALLQSYDGIIRLFPAVKPYERYSFSLYAAGGFRVSAIYDKGMIHASISSLRGGLLRLAIDNAIIDPVFECSGEYTFINGTFETSMKTGEYVIVKTKGYEPSVVVSDSENTDAKHLGHAVLGGEKEF